LPEFIKRKVPASFSGGTGGGRARGREYAIISQPRLSERGGKEYRLTILCQNGDRTVVPSSFVGVSHIYKWRRKKKGKNMGTADELHIRTGGGREKCSLMWGKEKKKALLGIEEKNRGSVFVSVNKVRSCRPYRPEGRKGKGERGGDHLKGQKRIKA